jgi:hypothetical protein
MRLDHSTRVRVAMVAAVLLLGVMTPIASTQPDFVLQASSLPPAQTSAVAWLADDVAAILVSEGMVLLACALWCGLLLGGVKAFERWHDRRAEWGAYLRARIVTALQRDRRLGRLPVTPIVHPPLWGRSHAAIELRGYVPTVRLHHAVLRTAKREVAASALACHILDRIAIAPSGKALAA